MEQCLERFHAHKKVFVREGIWEHFNIPKLHSLLHYIDSIKWLGSLDGYNTELPERLHINLAKDSFRASNKRDATEQMTLWLQRREAVWIREAYFTWLEGPSPLEANGDESLDEEDTIDDEAIKGMVNTTASRTINKVTHRITKMPGFQNVTMEGLANEFGAVDFNQALLTFLQLTIPRAHARPTHETHFNVYKQITICLPFNRYGSNKPRSCHICCVPAVPGKGCKPSTPVHFDTTLIIEDIPKYEKLGGISGTFVSSRTMKYCCTDNRFCN